MKKLVTMSGTTLQLQLQYVIFSVYSDVHHSTLYIDIATKDLIEQYEPLISIGVDKEVVFIKETKEVIEVYPISMLDVILLTHKDFCEFKFKELKAHFLKYYEHDLSLTEKIQLWGNTTSITPIEVTSDKLLKGKIMDFLALYKRPNFHFSLRNKIRDTYPFDFQLKMIAQNGLNSMGYHILSDLLSNTEITL